MIFWGWFVRVPGSPLFRYNFSSGEGLLVSPGQSFHQFGNHFSYEYGPFVSPGRVSVISVRVLPPGMVRLRPLFRSII